MNTQVNRIEYLKHVLVEQCEENETRRKCIHYNGEEYYTVLVDDGVSGPVFAKKENFECPEHWVHFDNDEKELEIMEEVVASPWMHI